MIGRSLPAGPHLLARVCCTARADGDFRVDGPADELAARRRRVADRPWTWLRQVHGARVVTVRRPGDGAGTEADAMVTRVPGAVLAVQTADCAPVVLAGVGVLGLVHAGWRGLVEGVIPATLELMRQASAGDVHALLGPCIGPAGYEFGEAELARVEAVTGPGVRATTDRGGLALDLPAAVRSVCVAGGVASFAVVGDGSGGDRPADTVGEDWYSHRTRGDLGRQATVAWLEAVA